MSDTAITTPAMGVFERYLTVWVALCVIAGMPNVFHAMGQVREHWPGIVTTVGINWLIKPFPMAVLLLFGLQGAQIVRRSRGWYERG